MRVMFESWFVQNKVDLVLSGHVHAYERSVCELIFFEKIVRWGFEEIWSEVIVYLWQERVSNVRYNITNGLSTPIRDVNAPIYITIGDGGNIEGIANRWVFFTSLLFPSKTKRTYFLISYVDEVWNSIKLLISLN